MPRRVLDLLGGIISIVTSSDIRLNLLNFVWLLLEVLGLFQRHLRMRDRGQSKAEIASRSPEAGLGKNLGELLFNDISKELEEPSTQLREAW